MNESRQRRGRSQAKALPSLFLLIHSASVPGLPGAWREAGGCGLSDGRKRDESGLRPLLYLLNMQGKNITLCIL